ncbi:MAG: PKD domain-containing protein, partial [Bacteroidales bacterium]|nr:PKD domain-containing protein [Bacteroidales bacterium]
VTSPEGCVDSLTTTIIVNPNPTPTIVSSSSEICFGFAAQLTCNTDMPVTSYLWNTNETIPSISVYPNTTSTYSVTVTTEKGCTGTAEIPITVNSLPEIYIIAPSNKICIGSDIILTGESNNNSVTYVWSTGENSNSITVSPLQTTSYTVIGTDENGCKDTTSLTITVNPLPIITLTASNAEVCDGNSTEIFASSNTPNTTYLWNTGETTSTVTVTPTVTSTYSIIGTDPNGCVGNSEILISVLPRPSLEISSPSETICKGDTTSLTANSPQAVSFAWSTSENSSTIVVSPNLTTTYSVIVTDIHGCTSTEKSTVTVRELPILTINNNDPNVCYGSSITLVVSGATLYDWSPSDGLNTNIGSTVIASPDTTTSYTVSGIDLYGCASTTNVVVTVNPLPTVDFTADERDICMATIVHFKGTSDLDIKEWAWNFGDAISGSSNTTYVQNPTHTFFETGSYTISLTATTTKGCKSTARKPNFIIVHPNPIASFTRTPDITTLDNPVISFYNQSLGENKYLWNFDDPGSGLYNNSIEENPTHKYSVEGIYWVTLLVENEWGCIDTVENRVIINPDWEKFIPSAFTPNNDGKNDYFRPMGFNIDYSEYSMYIYNRWGKEIFATNDIEDAWDGRVNRSGEIVPQGVYVYIIIIKDIRGIEHQFVGHVTVVK